METKEWRTKDRSKWGDGPWDAEPDKIQWTDPATELPCLMVRNWGGAWCGYAGVPREHPLHGKYYSDDLHVPESVLQQERNWDTCGIVQIVFADAEKAERGVVPIDVAINVHGGLTYASRCSGNICHVPGEGEPDDVWWFGFDCSHSSDFSPGLASPSGLFNTGTYRSRSYVERETASLAKQLREACGWS